MRNLFNMIALVATAIVMFYVGKSCTDMPIVPPAAIDSSIIKKHEQVIDSIKEQNRELEVIIYRQQDSLTEILSDMNLIKKQSAQTIAKYIKAKATFNVPEQTVQCDSVIREYALYREACETFVSTTDSLVSTMYDQSINKDKIIAQQDITINDISMAMIEAQANQKLYYDKADKAIQRKRKWQKISVALAALLGVTLLAR